MVQIEIAKGAVHQELLEKYLKRLSNPEYFEKVMKTKKMIDVSRGTFILRHKSGKRLLHYLVHFRKEPDKIVIW